MQNELRGLVMKAHPNITDFAKAMKWDRKKASRIINHVQKPTADDMEKMAEHLGISDPETFVRIFLPSVSTKWENNRLMGGQ